jgi:ferredoxin-NADP reductase
MLLSLAIRSVARATPRAVLVRLDLDGAEFPYLAGQAVLIGPARQGSSTAGGPPPAQPERRPYSIAAPPGDAKRRGELELLVGLDPAGAAPSWLGPLEPGIRLDVDGPHGTFVLPAETRERRFLFMAGGTGIAPLRAMLYEALGRAGTRSVSLVYSARTADEFAFGSEFRALAAAGRLTLWQTVTREVHAHWDGAKGRVALQHLREMLHDEPALCFLCGPHTFVRELGALLDQVGVPPDRIRVEDWGG